MDETYFYQESLRALGIEIDLKDISEKNICVPFKI